MDSLRRLGLARAREQAHGFGSVRTDSSGVGVGSAQSSNSASSSSSSSLVFTLPISCQICLSKVKDPVICSNRHVFCKGCMDTWLQRIKQCPACRVDITEENPLRSILGGLSVVEDMEDIANEDDASEMDVEKLKAARNSKKNLRKARIELLFNEYEEEIEELREELRDSKEKIGRTEDELRHVKETLGDAKNQLQQHQRWSPNSGKVAYGAEGGCDATAGSSVMAKKLVDLTAKLQEASETYSKVVGDMDSLKEEIANLKDDKENLNLEVNRLRSRLQLSSPRKMGRYTTVAMESEVASTRKEMEGLKKALAHADAQAEKMQEEQQHLLRFHGVCVDEDCPLTSAETNSASNTRRSPNSQSMNFEAAVRPKFGAAAAPAAAGSVKNSYLLSLPDSPSSSLGLLSLRSLAAAPSSFAASRLPSLVASKCSRNLFTPLKAREVDFAPSFSGSCNAVSGPTVDATRDFASSSRDHSFSNSIINATGSYGATGNTAESNAADKTTLSSMRFSLPSTSLQIDQNSFEARPRAASGASTAEEEACEVNVSLEPDVQDCLSLMRAAERKVRSRASLENQQQDEETASSSRALSTVPSAHASVSQAPTSTYSKASQPTTSIYPSISQTAFSVHSRTSSAATDSTIISVAFTSSSSEAPTWTENARSEFDLSFPLPTPLPPPLPPALPPRESARERMDQRTLKREISQGELPSNKNPKH